MAQCVRILNFPIMERPNYYAVLSAEVRYDTRLEASAKLLYAEITALTNKTGECFAKNEYFSGLYSVDERTIRRWKKSLEDCGYITNHYGRTKLSVSLEKADNFVQFSEKVDKNVRESGQKCPDATYSVFNNTLINSYSYENEKEQEEKKRLEMENRKTEKCYTVEDVESRIRVQNVLDEFWYKLGTLDDLRTNIAEMLNHYAESGKSIPANLAESRIKSWLKPKWETEEDRDELKKATKMRQKRAERIETIKGAQEHKKNDGDALSFDFDTIPEDIKARVLEMAKKEMETSEKWKKIRLSETARK